MSEDDEKYKIAGLVSEEDREELAIIMKVALTGRKFGLVGQLARLIKGEIKDE